MRPSEMRKAVLVSLVVIQLFPFQWAMAQRDGYIRIGVLVLEDDSAISNKFRSSLTDVLSTNKIPVDMVKPSSRPPPLADEEGNLRYSSVVVMGGSFGEALVPIVDSASRQGIGIVFIGSSIPDRSAFLKDTIGISAIGPEVRVQNLTIASDLFTIGYGVGEAIPVFFSAEAHDFKADITILATARERATDRDIPVIVEARRDKSIVLFYNLGNIEMSELYLLNGLLLQGILHSMPVGVASPMGVAMIHVDDGPRPLYSRLEADAYYRGWQSNFRDFLLAYNFSATYYMIFSYRDAHTDASHLFDIYVSEESMEWVHDVLASGSELGLHGGNHISLFVGTSPNGQRFDDDSEIILYMKNTMEAWRRLQSVVERRYRIALNDPHSYAPPANIIGREGYEALAQYTPVKWVSALSSWEHGPFADKVTVRETGWEKGFYNKIYNIPRTLGGILWITQGPPELYRWNMNALRNRVEAGGVFAIFTHPDEAYNVAGAAYKTEVTPRSVTIQNYTDALYEFGGLMTSSYPHLRWWTTSSVGKYLTYREGVGLEARYYPHNSSISIIFSARPTGMQLQVKNPLNVTGVTYRGLDLVIGLGRRVENATMPADLTLKSFNGNHFLTFAAEELEPKRLKAGIEQTEPPVLALVEAAAILASALVLGVYVIRKM